MIRLFIFVLIRFFLIAITIYAVLTLLKKVIQTLQGRSQPTSHPSQQKKRAKPKEDYKDVKDAKFIELPNNQAENKQDSPI
jgi:large-conductance mechanosensitive channel